jgi:hypothetical protein
LSRPSLEVADIFRSHGLAWAPSQCRSCEPQPIEGHVSHRELPYGGARRPCRALRELRAHPHRLQFLPQPALPKAPGRRRAPSPNPQPPVPLHIHRPQPRSTSRRTHPPSQPLSYSARTSTGLCTRQRRQLRPPIQPGNHNTRTEPHRQRYSNPHNVSAPHRRSPPGPRFPPPRLLGCLPPERVAMFFGGRHPRSLNDSGHSATSGEICRVRIAELSFNSGIAIAYRQSGHSPRLYRSGDTV